LFIDSFHGSHVLDANTTISLAGAMLPSGVSTYSRIFINMPSVTITATWRSLKCISALETANV
jgi:hypothetical protein